MQRHLSPLITFTKRTLLSVMSLFNLKIKDLAANMDANYNFYLKNKNQA